ncbi:unnamed protein product [Trifolium pratense]|uniref:Uncharacterized protein n=1 Tax=Trifolium pratense TaxID=57577 RepID=A0ACB0MCA1_TRIPR|nr:unnamed protein product [Trifolium pratense]
MIGNIPSPPFVLLQRFDSYLCRSFEEVTQNKVQSGGRLNSPSSSVIRNTVTFSTTSFVGTNSNTHTSPSPKLSVVFEL